MIPRLTLNHLTVLAALAEARGVTATAARLGLTQSAVSHRLREAERRLGVPLVRRVDGAMTLTPEGERVRALADRVLDELVRLEQELAVDRGGERRLVRLGQATYSRYHWLPAFLEFVERNAPDLSVDLSARAASRPFAALVEGSVDVSTVYGRPSALPRFRWRKLATDPLIGVVARSHRLASADYLDTRSIEDERYYSYPLSAEPGFEWEALLGAPSVPIRRITHMPTPEAVIDLVRAGFGVGIFSRWAVRPELSDGTLIEKPLGPEGMAVDWWAVTRAGDAPDGPANRLAAALVRWGGGTEAGLATLGFDGDGR